MVKVISKEGEIAVSFDRPDINDLVLRMVQKSEKNERFCEDLINNVKINQ